MVRVMRGDVAMVVEVWRAATKVAAHERHGEMQVALEAQLYTRGQAVARSLILRAGPRLYKAKLLLVLQAMRTNLAMDKQCSRGKQLMNRVWLRLASKELMFALQNMKTKLVHEKHAAANTRWVAEVARVRRDLIQEVSDARTGAAVRQLRQIMVRVVRVNMATLVQVWRAATKIGVYTRHWEMQAALEAQMRAQEQALDVISHMELARLRAELEQAAVHGIAEVAAWVLRGIVSRLTQIDIGRLLEVWCLQTGTSRLETRVAAATTEAAQTAFIVSTRTNLRQLQHIYAWIVRQVVHRAVRCWRETFEREEQQVVWQMLIEMEEAVENHRNMQGLLEEQLQSMAAASHSGGVLRVRRVVIGMMNQDVSFRLSIWRLGMSDAIRAAAMVRAREELEQKTIAISTGTAVRQLRQIIVRMLRGDIAMLVGLWRTSVHMNGHERQVAMQVAMQVALEAQMHAQSQGIAASLMSRVKARMSSNELAFSLQSMRTNLAEDKSCAKGTQLMKRVRGRMTNNELVCALHSMRTNLVENNRRVRGRRLLKRVQARMTSKELASALQTLRANLANEKQAHAIAIQTAESTRARKELERKAMDAGRGTWE